MNLAPALVLNADYQPLSYFPLSLWGWEDVIKAVFKDRVAVVAEYDTVVRSPSFEMKLPSVVALREYQVPQKRPSFTKFNVFLRDHFECQYCGSPDELTFDHVVPKSHGGKTCWTNIVAACLTCNGAKDNKYHMKPRVAPIEPTIHQLQVIGKKFPPNYLHESWSDFLYWDTELQTS
jgi:5-methylcytosine-specific restriction endonuclease McrA